MPKIKEKPTDDNNIDRCNVLGKAITKRLQTDTDGDIAMALSISHAVALNLLSCCVEYLHDDSNSKKESLARIALNQIEFTATRLTDLKSQFSEYVEEA